MREDEKRLCEKARLRRPLDIEKKKKSEEGRTEKWNGDGKNSNMMVKLDINNSEKMNPFSLIIPPMLKSFLNLIHPNGLPLFGYFRTIAGFIMLLMMFFIPACGGGGSGGGGGGGGQIPHLTI